VLKQDLSILEPKQYSAMRQLIDNAEEMAQKIENANKRQLEFENSLSIDTDHRIIHQRLQIAELFTSLHSAQETLDKITASQAKFGNFVESENSVGVFEAELRNLRQEFQAVRDRRAEMISKLYEKHDHSLSVTQRRADMIISDAETVAAKHHISELSDEAMDMMERNRMLKERVAQVYKEYGNLAGIVERLERDNGELVKRNVGVEWNLTVWSEDHGYNVLDGESDDDEVQDELLDLGWIQYGESDEEQPALPINDQEAQYNLSRLQAQDSKIPRPQQSHYKQDSTFTNFSKPIPARNAKPTVLKQSRFKINTQHPPNKMPRRSQILKAAVQDFMTCELESREIVARCRGDVEVVVNGIPMGLSVIDGINDGGQRYRGSISNE